MANRGAHRPARVAVIAAGLILALTAIGRDASAAEAPVGLGTATSFAVLAGSTVTNTGPTIVSGDLGVSPGTAVTGFPPGIVSNGTIRAADVAAQAQADLTTAYNDAAGRSTTESISADLGGRTLVSGVYTGPTLGLTGALTLDAKGDAGAVFIFQSASTLITAPSSSVSLINGASACNVFWQVRSSATLGTASVFVGSVLALTSITANTGARVEGRLLARNGAVTLDSNLVNRPACTVVPPSTTTTVPATTTTTSVPVSTTTTVVPATTTTAVVPATTTTTVPATTTTTVPATTTTTTTTVPATTTTTVPATTTTTTTGATTGSGQSTGTSRTTGAGGSANSRTLRTTRQTATGLARTGMRPVNGVLVGLALLLVGVGLLAASRRTHPR